MDMLRNSKIKKEKTNQCLPSRWLETIRKIKSYLDWDWFKNIKLKALPVHDDRYIKTKIRAFDDKVYTNFLSLILLENVIECKSFTVISTDSLLEKEFYLEVYLDYCAYKTVKKQLTDYLMKIFLRIRYYKCCITIELI